MFARIFRKRSWLCSAVCAAVVLPVVQRDGPWVLELVFTLSFLVISVVIHEIAHGVVADWCGDPTAKDLGRLTLNPIPHIDPMMTVIVPAAMYLMSGGAMIFGGAKPVPVNFNRLRHPMRDMMLVALAGPASNFLLAVVFMLGWKVAVVFGHYGPNELLPSVMNQSLNLNLLLAAFNMIPIPPPDGSRVMTWLLPPPLRPGYMALDRIGMLIVVAVWFYVPPVKAFVGRCMGEMFDVIYLVTGGRW